MKKRQVIFIVLTLLISLNVKAQNCWEYEEYEVQPVQRIGGGIVISEVYFDTHYSEDISTRYHHFGEYVELYNSTTEDINLSGWKIQDYENYYIFPNSPDTVIPSGGTIIVTYGGRMDPDSPWIGIQKGKEKFIELFPETEELEEYIYVQNHFVLFNRYAAIELYNNFGLLIDRVIYSEHPECITSSECNYVGSINNGNAGVFNGKIYNDTNERLIANDQPPLDDPEAIKYYKKAIYKENIEDYYDNDNYSETYAIADATPFSVPYPIVFQEPSDGLDSSPPPSDTSEIPLVNFNNNKNYIYTETFDVNNTMIGKSGSYYNRLGHPTIGYSWDSETNKVWGTETKYDKQGRPALNTFPAPNCDGFDGGFLNGSFNNFVSSNGDYDQLLPINSYINSFTSLKRYYSDENSNEAFQATTSRPYSRTVYDKLNPGNVIKTIGGNQVDGEWKNGYTFTVPAAQELYYIFGRDYFNGPVTSNGEEVITKFYKTVVIDAHGVESVVFTDSEGKTLASARSGGSIEYEVVSVVGEQGFIDVHIPANNSGFSFLTDPSDYVVYDLKTGELIDSSLMSAGNVYRIETNTLESEHKVYIDNSNALVAPNAKGIRYNVNYYDYAINYYDDIGRLMTSSQPLGFDENCLNGIQNTVSHGMLSDYNYDVLGQLIETSSPDEGTAKFKYREDGQIRFSQNSKQALVNEVSFTNYDHLARPIESGVGNADFTNLNPDTDNLTVGLKEVHKTLYDEKDPNFELILSTNELDPLEYQQSFLSGNVSMTGSLTDGVNYNARTWYNYDIYGRVVWTVQHIEGLGLKTIHYKYDSKGNVKQVIFQKDQPPGLDVPAELFIHQYTYNLNNAIVKVETSSDNLNFTEHATYEYYRSGELKRTEIAGGIQGKDYVYTLGGQLKSINSPNLNHVDDPGKDANDIFGMTLDYYSGDYIRPSSTIATSPNGSNRYDGNIKATRWATKGLTNPNTQDAYTYDYNRNKWLTGATFGNVTSGDPEIEIVDSNDYEVSNITYDANGNIITLERTKNSVDGDNNMDELSYNYDPETNQLNYVDDGITVDIPDANDIEPQSPDNYDYNDIGQLIENRQEGLKYEYNTSGLVTHIRHNLTNELIVSYEYDDKNQRIATQNYSQGMATNKTFYIRDINGNPFGLYNDTSLQEHPIYGASRLGVHYKQDNDNNNVYQLSDHLGNVRALFKPELGANPVIYQEDFNNITAPPTQWSSWVISDGAELSISNDKMKCEVNKNWDGALLIDLPLQAGKEYQFNYTYIKNAMQTNVQPMIYNVLDYTTPVYEGESIANGGEHTLAFTPTSTGTFGFVIRAQNIPDYPDDTAFLQTNSFLIDDVSIRDVTLETFAHTDYYPFGMPMPNRNIETDYKYGYQGEFAEKEDAGETGATNSFQLRLWDARIGRWLSTDPYGQYNSPYLGMGNNPIKNIDPDGGYSNWFEASAAWLFGGFQGTIRNTGLGGNKNYSIYKGSFQNDGEGSFGTFAYQDHFGTGLWDNDYVRKLTGDGFSIGASFSGNVFIGADIGGEFTWIFRGEDASLVPVFEFGPAVSISDGGQVTANAWVSKKWHAGEVSEIKATDLGGYSFFADVGFTAGIGGSIGGDIAGNFENGKFKPTWISATLTGSAGAEASPLTGVQIEAGVRHNSILIHNNGNDITFFNPINNNSYNFSTDR